jgi:hypothetical protein
MKLHFLFLLKLYYYYAIFLFMRNLKYHVSGDSYELIEYWETVYHLKVKKIIKIKAKRIFKLK